MRLADWLKQEGLTDSAFARQLGRTQSAVWRWRQPVGSDHFQRPRDADMAKIVQATGGQVQPGDFYDLPEPAPGDGAGREAA